MAFMLAFFGAICISELLPRNKKFSAGILFQHIVISETRLQIFIPHSKTDQTGKGVSLFIYGD